MTAPVQLEVQMLRALMSEAAAMPLHAMKERQKGLIAAQGEFTQKHFEAQAAMLERLAPTHSEFDPLRKLRENDPQFPVFTGKSEHFLAWVVECQMRKEQRDLPDAVAIQYAKMALGESIRGMFPPNTQFDNWEDFVQKLKPKFLLHTADWSLYLETYHWQMNGDWPRFHAIVQTYRLFIPKDMHYTLMVHMIKGLDEYLQRKVMKEPRHVDPDKAIGRTWQVFQTAQPRQLLMPEVPQPTQAPAIAPPRSAQSQQEIELYLMPEAPRQHEMTFNSMNPQ
jgi:hypothetical protein